MTTVGALTGGESAQSAEAVSGAASSGSVLVILDRIDIGGEWRFDALLRRTAATGCQVVAVHSTAAEDANLSLLADRLGLVVLGVSDPWQFSVDLRDLLSNSRAVMADAVLRATHAGQRAGGSVENLLSVLLNTFQRSFFLLDSSGRPMTGADVLSDADRAAAGMLSGRGGAHHGRIGLWRGPDCVPGDVRRSPRALAGGAAPGASKRRRGFSLSGSRRGLVGCRAPTGRCAHGRRA